MKKLLYLFTIVFMACFCLNVYADEALTSIEFTGIVEPVIGEKVYQSSIPTYVFNPGEGAIPDEMGWFKAKDGFSSSNLNHDYIMENADLITDMENAKYGEGTYILLIGVKPNEGYTVSPSLTTKVNGNNVSYYVRVTEDTFIELYYVVTLVQKYTVTFDANGGSGTMDPVSDLVGDYDLPTSTFTAPKGKKFKGWSLSNNGEITSSINVTDDVVVYAIWEVIPVNNPKTADNVVIYTVIGIVSFFGLLYSFIYFKKKRFS